MATNTLAFIFYFIPLGHFCGKTNLIKNDAAHASKSYYNLNFILFLNQKAHSGEIAYRNTNSDTFLKWQKRST